MAIPLNTHPVGFEAELQRIVARINRRGLNVKVNSSSFTQPLGRITNKANEFQKSIEASNARVIAFGASAAIIGSVGKAFEQMIVQAVKVEKILTDINVVLNTTSHNLEKFGTQLFDVARNTSQALDVAAEAALEFSRQGLTMEETLSRTNDALILTRLTGMKAADAVKGLTAAVNSYSQAGVTTTEIINKLAAVDVKFAVSADDLVAALSRAGAVAQDAGLSMDQLVAAVTSAQQITARGGAVIGNSFKTIFTRLQRSSTISSLDELGVKVTDVAGRTRGAMDIMTDLAKTYDTLADSTQAAVAEQVGGVFQINILKAAMKDLGKQNSLYSQALGISTGATNEAAVKNAMLQETLSSLAAQTSLTMQELASNIGDLALAPGIETLLKQLNSLGEGLNDLLGGDSEGIGSDFAKGIMKGIGNVITGPGMVLAIGVFGKLFFNALKFAKQSLKDILGIVTQKEKEKKLQDSILEAMLANKTLAYELNKAAGDKVKQERIILDTIEEQTRQMEIQRKIAASLAPALAKRGISPDLGTTAEGFVPNFNQSPNNYTKKKEMREASKAGYSSGAVKLMEIPGYGQVAYNQAEKIKKFRGMKQPAIMPPKQSRAGSAYKDAFSTKHGFDPYAARGFVPNFAELYKTRNFSTADYSIFYKTPLDVVDRTLGTMGKMTPETERIPALKHRRSNQQRRLEAGHSPEQLFAEDYPITSHNIEDGILKGLLKGDVTALRAHSSKFKNFVKSADTLNMRRHGGRKSTTEEWLKTAPPLATDLGNAYEIPSKAFEARLEGLTWPMNEFQHLVGLRPGKSYDSKKFMSNINAVRDFKGMAEDLVNSGDTSNDWMGKSLGQQRGLLSTRGQGLIPNFTDNRTRQQKIKDTLADPSNKDIKFTGGKLGAKSIKSKNMFQKMWLESYFKNGLEGDYQMLMKMGYDPDELKNLRAHSKRGGKVNILGKGFIPNFSAPYPASATAAWESSNSQIVKTTQELEATRKGTRRLANTGKTDQFDVWKSQILRRDNLHEEPWYGREANKRMMKWFPPDPSGQEYTQYFNERSMEGTLRWFTDMGVDPSAIGGIRTSAKRMAGTQPLNDGTFLKVKGPDNKPTLEGKAAWREKWGALIASLKGVFGEIDASKMTGLPIGQGNEFLDIGGLYEVKTKSETERAEILRKYVNTHLGQLKPPGLLNQKKDFTDLGQGTVITPKGAKLIGRASGFVPSFAASLNGGTLRLDQSNFTLAAGANFRNQALDNSFRKSLQTGQPFYLEEDVSKIAGKQGSHNYFIHDVLSGIAKEGVNRIGRNFRIRGKVRTARMKRLPGEKDYELQERAQINDLNKNLQGPGGKYKSTGGESGDSTFPVDAIARGRSPVEVKDGELTPGNVLLKSLRLYSDSQFLDFVAEKYPKLASSISSANLAHRDKSERLLRTQGVIPNGVGANQTEAAILEHLIARGFVPNFNVKLKKTDGKIDPNQIFKTDPRRSSNDELFKPSEGQGIKQSTVQGEIHNTTTGQTSFGRRSMKTLKASDSASEPSSFDSVNVKKEKEKSLKLLSDPKAMGFVPNFADPLREAIGREAAAGIPKSMMRIERDSSLENRGNPLGLAVTNTRDEPFGVRQGIMRAKARGINPQSHGAGSGFVPSYAAGDPPPAKGWNKLYERTEKLQGALFSLSTMTYFLAGTFEQSGNKIGASITNAVQMISNAVLTLSVVGPMTAKWGQSMRGFSDKLKQATATRGSLGVLTGASDRAAGRSLASEAAGGGRGARLGARLGANKAGRGLSKIIGGAAGAFGRLIPFIGPLIMAFQVLAPLVGDAMKSAGTKFIEKMGEMAKVGERASAALALMATQAELVTKIEDLKNKGSSKTHEEQMKMLRLQDKSFGVRTDLNTKLAILASSSNLTSDQIEMLGGTAQERSEVLRKLERDAAFGKSMKSVLESQKKLVSENNSNTSGFFSAFGLDIAENKEKEERDRIVSKGSSLIDPLLRIGDQKRIEQNLEAVRKSIPEIEGWIKDPKFNESITPKDITDIIQSVGQFQKFNPSAPFRFGSKDGSEDPQIHFDAFRNFLAELDEWEGDDDGVALSTEEAKMMVQILKNATNFGADRKKEPEVKDKGVGRITVDQFLGRANSNNINKPFGHVDNDPNKIFQGDPRTKAWASRQVIRGNQKLDTDAKLPLSDIHQRALRIVEEEEKAGDAIKLFTDEIYRAQVEGKHMGDFMKIMNKVLVADIALERGMLKDSRTRQQQDQNLLNAQAKALDLSNKRNEIEEQSALNIAKEDDRFLHAKQDLTKKTNDQMNALTKDLMRKGTGTLFSSPFADKLKTHSKESSAGGSAKDPVVSLFAGSARDGNKAAIEIINQMAEVTKNGRLAADHADIVAVLQAAMVGKASREHKLAIHKILVDEEVFSKKQDYLSKVAALLKEEELGEKLLQANNAARKNGIFSQEQQNQISSKTSKGAELVLASYDTIVDRLAGAESGLVERLKAESGWAEISIQTTHHKIKYLQSTEGSALLAERSLAVETDSIGKRFEALIMDIATLDARAEIRQSSELLAKLAKVEVQKKIKQMNDDEATAQEEHVEMMSQGGFGVKGRNQINERRRGMQGDVEVAKAQVTQYSLEGNSIRAAEAMAELTNAVKELNVEQGTGTLFSDSIRAKIAEADAAASRFAETLANTSFDSVNSGFKQLFKDLSTGTESVGHNVLKFFASIAEKIQDKLFEHAANRMTSGLFKIFGIDEYHSGGIVTNYNTGGYSKGDVPAMLTTGEYVVRKKAVDKIGQEALEKMNKGESLEDLFDKPNDESFDIIGDGMKEFSPKVNDMQTIADPSLMSNFLKDNSQEPNTPEENSGISEALFENLNQKNSGKESSLPQLISSMVQKRKPEPSKTESKTTSLEKVVSNTVRSKELRNLDKIENNTNFLEKITNSTSNNKESISSNEIKSSSNSMEKIANNISSSKEKERVSLISSLVSNSSKESSSSNSAESTSSSIGKIINNISKSKEVGQSSSISQSQIRDSIVRSDNTSSSVDKMVSNISKSKEVGQSSSVSQSQITDSIVSSDNTSSSVDKMVSNSISKYKEIAGNMSSSNQSTSAISETSSLIDRNAKSLEKVMSKESRYREGGRVSSSSHSSSNILKLNSGGLVSNVIKLNDGGLSMNSLNQRDSSGKKQAWDDIAYGTGMGTGAALAGYLNRDKSPPGDPPEPPKMSSLNTRGALNLNVTDPRLSAKFRRADDTSQQYGKYLLDKYEYDIAAKNKKVRDKASFVQTIGSTLVMGAGMAIGSKMAKGMTNSINGVRMSGSGMTIGKGNTGETIKMHRGSDGTMYATEGGRPVDIMGNAPGKVQSPASQHLAKWKMGQGLGGGDMTSSQAGKWWSDYSSSGRPGFASNFKTGEMQGPPDKRTWQQHFSQAKVQSLPGSKQPTSFYNYKTSPKHRGGLITKNFNSGGNVLNESSLTQVNIDRQRKDELDKIYKDSIVPMAQPQRFSGGGKVFGPAGIDKVGPVMLDSGEFVIKSSSVNSIEKQFPGMLDKMNEARGYADGGIVEKSSPVNKSETNDNSSSSSNVTINVNLSSGGSEESQSSGGGNGQALGLKLKAAVLQVLSDEKRVGGMLRGY